MDGYVAFFDLDDTVFSINSGKLMVRYAAENGLMKKRQIVWLYLFAMAYRMHILTEKFIMSKIAQFLKGLPEEKLVRYTEEIFKRFLKDSIRQQAKDAIQKHKENGAQVIILSASTPYICRQVQAHLNLDGYLCSELQVIEGRLSGKPLKDYCYGREKANRIYNYCQENQLKPDDSWYYGDAPSDRPAMEAVGNPVCISPGRHMQRVARKKNWRVEFW